MAKQLLTPLRLIARMNFSLKNYSCELLTLTGTVGKVELISTFTTAVCESWNVSNKYTWDNAGDLKRLSMDQTIGVIKRQSIRMVTNTFDKSVSAEKMWQVVPGRLQLHDAIYRPDSFILMLRYCVNLKAIRYESMSSNRIVTDKSHRVIVAEVV